MMKMEISQAHMKVFFDFTQYANAVQDELHKELDSIALDIINNIKLKMRNTKRSAKPTGKNGHRPSLPGAPPAPDGGRLINSFEARRIGGIVEVGTNVEYAKYLQSGTKGGTIRVKKAKSLTNGVNFFGKEVQHPGIKARPFLEPGIADIDFRARFAEAIQRGFKQ